MKESMDPRYPIGRFETPQMSTAQERAEWLRELADLPGALQALLAGIEPEDLARPYREGGWTVLQVVHHMADSHMNAYIRAKWALTEDRPTIKPYDEAVWAELRDARSADVQVSIDLLRALHARWVMLLESLEEAQWQRAFVHPEMGTVRLDQQTAHYAWHSRHHFAHIRVALGR